MNSYFRFLFLFALGFSGVLHAEPPPPRRLAILSEEDGKDATGRLVALLEAQLLQQDGRLVLLERAKLDRLLTEQKLGFLQEGGVDARQVVNSGKLWGVDVFCILSTDHPRVRLQLIDAWHGIRVLDQSLVVSGKDGLEKSAQMFAARILQTLPTVSRDAADLRLVGLLDFKSTEPTSRLDDLARPLRSALEQQAVLRPDLIVAEREQMEPLLDERELAGHLPESIRASVVLVDGEFHLDAENPELLHLYVQGRRNGEQVFRFQVEGRRQDLEALAVDAAAKISHSMGEMKEGIQMDPELEAEMLMAMSKASRDLSSSLGALAAARALMPGVEEYEVAWLEKLAGLRKDRPFDAARFQKYIDDCEKLILARIEKQDFDPEEDLKVPLTLFHRCGYILEDSEGLRPEDRQHFRVRLFALLRQSWDRYAATVRTPPREVYSTQESFYEILCAIRPADADEAFQFYAELSTAAPIRLIRFMSRRVEWPEYVSDAERYQLDHEFYSWMTARERPMVRLAGLRGLARIAVHPDSPVSREKAREAYEKFEQEFIENYLPNTHHDAVRGIARNEAYRLWIEYFLDERGFDRDAGASRYFEDEEKSRQYRAERIVKIMRIVLTESGYPERVQWIWGGALLSTLKRADRVAEQAELHRLNIAYYQRGLERYEGHNSDHKRWIRKYIGDSEESLNRLITEHPELREGTPAPQNPLFQAEHLLIFDKVQEPFKISGSPSRLILAHGMAAVLTSGGVLFLDPEFLRPLRFEPAPKGTRTSAIYAVDDSGIYSASRNGILHFPRVGSAKLFFKDHEDLTIKLFGMDVLKNRVFVLTGPRSHQRGTNMLEFDLSTGIQSVLLTSKAKVKEQMIPEVSEINYVFSEVQKNCIHFSVRRGQGESSVLEPFIYDPDTKICVSAKEMNVNPFLFGKIRRRGDLLLNVHAFGISESRLGEGYPQLALYKSYDHRFDSYGPITRIGEGFVGLYHWSDEMNFIPGEGQEMLKLKLKVFPSDKGKAPRLVDLATHPEHGVLILSGDGIYALSEFSSAVRKGGLRWSELQGGSVK